MPDTGVFVVDGRYAEGLLVSRYVGAEVICRLGETNLSRLI